MDFKTFNIDIEKFSKSSDKRDIFGILQKIKLNKNEVILWQPRKTSKFIQNAYVSVVDPHQGRITLTPISHESFKFKQGNTLYFFSEEVPFVIKEKIATATSNFIILEVPNEAVFIDQRSAPRFRIPPHQSPSCRLRLIEPHFGQGKDISLKLQDLSQTGMCFKVSAKSLSTLKYCNRVFIMGVNSQDLVNHIPGEVRYLEAIKSASKNKIYRLGLKLDMVIENELFSRILKGNA